MYSFSFDKEEGEGSYDVRVHDTIISILADFFDAENVILGYTCDVTDGREMARKKLFDRWFEQENDGSLKKIVHGQLLVLHGGKTYTVQGQEVK